MLGVGHDEAVQTASVLANERGEVTAAKGSGIAPEENRPVSRLPALKCFCVFSSLSRRFVAQWIPRCAVVVKL